MNSGRILLKGQLFCGAVVSVFIGIALYAAFIVVIDLNLVGSSLYAPGLAGWVAILGLSLVNYFLRFLRWHGYILALGCRIDFISNLRYYLAGFAFTTTPGKAGEALRSVYLRRHGVSYYSSLAAFFVERFLDVVTMMLLALLAVLIFESFTWFVIVTAVGTILVFPVVGNKKFPDQLRRMGQRTTRPSIHNVLEHLAATLRTAQTLLRSSMLYMGVGVGIIAWAAEAFGFYLILKYIGVPLPILMAIGIFATSMLVGALSMIPGGLGSTETVMVALLVSSGTAVTAAGTATVLCRLATLWFAVGIGFVNAVTLLRFQSPANSRNVSEENRPE